jgi:hypothetical protein
MSISGRGGYREGSGRPSPWNNKKTVAVRVPECFAQQVVEYARKLDTNDFIDTVHNQNTSSLDIVQIHKVLEILKAGLPIKAGNGGAIKAKIREAIEVLEVMQR